MVVVPRLAEGRQDEPEDVGDSSAVAKRRRPNTWQIELMLYVGWWSTNSRTAPPHSSPVRPAVTLPPIATPSPNGSASPASAHTTKVRSTKRIVRSASRSGA
jgi:hypothetical protein